MKEVAGVDEGKDQGGQGSERSEGMTIVVREGEKGINSSKGRGERD